MNGIYLLTCNDEKCYVGVSQNPTCRIRNHLSGNGSRLVKEALEKGASFNSLILLEHEDLNYIYSLEPEYIKKYNSLYPNGYNLDVGGKIGGISDRKGSKNTQAILNEESVLEIRNLYSLNSRYTQEILASIYNVNRETISALVRGKSWKEVGGPITIKSNKDLKTPDNIITEIKNLRRLTKLTYNQIALKLNITSSVAAKYGKGVKYDPNDG